ncbi:MAG TPA: tRNA adenosine deaminase-associated protein [Mycobacteriales bacterium]|nr:tRNA adenosine deaminase-associated protein [Mycobacteriales bacterium]
MHFAVALACCPTGWIGNEVDLGEVADVEALAECLRDLSGDTPGPALLLLEENDEYVAVVRVDGGAGSLSEPRIFLSDRRAVQGSDVAAMLWEDAVAETDDVDDDGEDGEDDDEDESGRPVAEPVGEAALLADLGVSAADLLALCAEEGLLPADVIQTICERVGCADLLDELREG